MGGGAPTKGYEKLGGLKCLRDGSLGTLFSLVAGLLLGLAMPFLGLKRCGGR